MNDILNNYHIKAKIIVRLRIKVSKKIKENVIIFSFLYFMFTAL